MNEPWILEGECTCAARLEATELGDFLWSEYRHGWVVPPWTVDRSTWNTALDVVFHDCPWCGHELPDGPGDCFD